MDKRVMAMVLGAVLSMGAAKAEMAPAVRVKITLSDAAVAELTRLGEKVTLWAAYFGKAKRGVPTEDGDHGLAGQEVQLIAAPVISATLPAVEMKKADLDKIDGPPQFLINVYTARTKVDSNLIDCGIWQDDLAKAPAAAIEIACKLIRGE